MKESESSQLGAENPVPLPVTGQSGPRATDGWSLQAWLLLAVLVAGTLMLYWPAMRCGFVDYDDEDYVFANPRVLAGLSWPGVEWAFTTEQAANWHPLTWLSLMLDVTLFGKNAAGFHFTNVVLHAVNVGLLFWLLQWLSAATWRSAMVAALFACHPLHVQSVAWISERKDVLSAGCGFVTLLLYSVYARQLEARRETPAGGRRFYLSPVYWLACFCFVLGLLSKPMLVTWPFVLLLLDYWPLARWRAGRIWPLVGEKLPFFILAAAASGVTFLVQRQGGAVDSTADLTWGMRVVNALVSYCRYLGKLFWPSHLSIFYPHSGYWPAEFLVLALVFLAGASVIVFGCRRRHPFLVAGWLWFLGTLVPVIGLVQVGFQSMADRYAYLPSVGIFVAVVWGVVALARNKRVQMAWPAVAGGAMIFIYILLTRQQLGYWQDSEALFQHALAVTKGNYIAHNGLGIALATQGRTTAAIAEFQEALRLKPDFADAHYNLGLALTLTDQPAAGITQYQEALRFNPAYAQARENIGLNSVRLGRTEEALTQFQEALKLRPDNAAFHNNFGRFLVSQGETNAAIKEFQEALRQAPDDPNAPYSLGTILAKEGQTDAAIDQFRQALRISPKDAILHDNLGNLLARTGRNDEAISEFQEALRLKPDYAKAHDNLGVMMAKQGHDDEAISEFQEALRLGPGLIKAHDDLGFVLTGEGRVEEAIQQFQEVLRLSPNDAGARTNLAKALALKNQVAVPVPKPGGP